jgi:2-methylcitrate synthase
LPGARDIADRLMASLGSMLLYWHHYAHHGRRIEVETDDDSIGAHFLHLLHGRKPSASHERAMHTSLILYAEHEFNASTFTAPIHRRHRLGHVFGYHRRHRRPARSQARRRQ